jgi:hypothetical protein
VWEMRVGGRGKVGRKVEERVMGQRGAGNIFREKNEKSIDDRLKSFMERKISAIENCVGKRSMHKKEGYKKLKFRCTRTTKAKPCLLC